MNLNVKCNKVLFRLPLYESKRAQEAARATGMAAIAHLTANTPWHLNWITVSIYTNMLTIPYSPALYTYKRLSHPQPCLSQIPKVRNKSNQLITKLFPMFIIRNEKFSLKMHCDIFQILTLSRHRSPLIKADDYLSSVSASDALPSAARTVRTAFDLRTWTSLPAETSDEHLPAR